MDGGNLNSKEVVVVGDNQNSKVDGDSSKEEVVAGDSHNKEEDKEDGVNHNSKEDKVDGDSNKEVIVDGVTLWEILVEDGATRTQVLNG